MTKANELLYKKRSLVLGSIKESKEKEELEGASLVDRCVENQLRAASVACSASMQRAGSPKQESRPYGTCYVPRSVLPILGACACVIPSVLINIDEAPTGPVLYTQIDR